MGAQRLELKGLDRLLKALKDRSKPYIRIGILGSHASAAHSGGITNAEVGAAHEYGTATHPIRSFLRMPLTDHFQKNLEASGALTKEAMVEVLNQGSIDAWLSKVAIVAEDTVSTAFDTGGYGQWVSSDMRYKTVHQTLVETQQLRNSITYEIKRGSK